jgi:CHAT domain-containing protein/tetratricopeptide (TPR) repeat protein
MRHAGRTAEAATAADAMLLLERQLFSKNNLDLAGALEFVARMHDFDADFEPALAALHEAVAIRAKAADAMDWQAIDDHYSLDRIGRLTKLNVAKRQRYREALRLLDKAGVLGRKSFQVGEAINRLKEAAAILKEVVGANHPEYAMALERLGKYHQMILTNNREDDPQWWRMSALLTQARDIRGLALGEMHPDYAESLENLFAMAPNDDDPSRARAEPLLRQALEVRRQTQGTFHPVYAQCLRRLAYVLEWKPDGDLEEADALNSKSLAIHQKLFGAGDLLCDGDLQALARIARKRGQLDHAEGYVRQRVESARERLASGATSGRSGWIGTLGAMPDFDELRWLNQFNAHVRIRNYASTLHDLACLRGERGDAPEAGRLMDECLDLYNKGLDLNAAFRTGFEFDPLSTNSPMLMLARFLTISLDPEAKVRADDAYRQALAWKGSYFTRDLTSRRWRNQPEFAPLFQELQTVAGELAKRVLARPEAADRPAWDRIATLMARKDHLDDELTQRLMQQDPHENRGRPETDQLKALLPRDSALVDFQFFFSWKGWGDTKQNQYRLLAFVVRPDRATVELDLGPARPFQQAIDQWRSAVENLRDPARAAAVLKQILWEPLEPHLDGVRTLLVSPDGDLCRFPWAALPGKSQDSYLIETTAVVVVPVPQLLISGVPFDPSPPSLVLVGDVDFDAEPGTTIVAGGIAGGRRGIAGASARGRLMKFRPLAGTRREITLVRDHFAAAYPDSPVITLRGSEATEQAFRKSLTRPRFIHLATHGFFLPPEMAARSSGTVDSQNYWSSTPQGLSRIHPGLLSGITFAGANRQPTPDRDDGILTAVEAQQLDLAGTDLVVLSACETALGTSTHGEGLMGLQRAFQVAGARSLASSLWQVDDDATAALMDEFYLNLWERKLPKLDALRQAQLTILRRYDPGRLQQGRVQEVEAKNVQLKPGSPAPAPRRLHPYFWAAFTLSGDWH